MQRLRLLAASLVLVAASAAHAAPKCIFYSDSLTAQCNTKGERNPGCCDWCSNFPHYLIEYASSGAIAFVQGPCLTPTARGCSLSCTNDAECTGIGEQRCGTVGDGDWAGWCVPTNTTCTADAQCSAEPGSYCLAPACRSSQNETLTNALGHRGDSALSRHGPDMKVVGVFLGTNDWRNGTGCWGDWDRDGRSEWEPTTVCSTPRPLDRHTDAVLPMLDEIVNQGRIPLYIGPPGVLDDQTNVAGQPIPYEELRQRNREMDQWWEGQVKARGGVYVSLWRAWDSYEQTFGHDAMAALFNICTWNPTTERYEGSDCVHFRDNVNPVTGWSGNSFMELKIRQGVEKAWRKALRGTIDVPLGTGATIIAAMQANPDARLRLAAGTYTDVMIPELEWQSFRGEIVGQGVDVTILEYPVVTGANGNHAVLDLGGSNQDIRIADLTIDGNKENQTDPDAGSQEVFVGLDLNDGGGINTDGFCAHKVKVVNTISDGFKISNATRACIVASEAENIGCDRSFAAMTPQCPAIWHEATFPASSVNPGADTIDLGGPLHIHQQLLGWVYTTTGTPIAPLTPGTRYFLSRPAGSNIATVYSDQELTTPINLTSQGSGSHTFARDRSEASSAFNVAGSTHRIALLDNDCNNVNGKYCYVAGATSCGNGEDCTDILIDSNNCNDARICAGANGVFGPLLIQRMTSDAAGFAGEQSGTAAPSYTVTGMSAQTQLRRVDAQNCQGNCVNLNPGRADFEGKDLGVRAIGATGGPACLGAGSGNSSIEAVRMACGSTNGASTCQGLELDTPNIVDTNCPHVLREAESSGVTASGMRVGGDAGGRGTLQGGTTSVVDFGGVGTVGGLLYDYLDILETSPSTPPLGIRFGSTDPILTLDPTVAITAATNCDTSPPNLMDPSGLCGPGFADEFATAWATALGTSDAAITDGGPETPDARGEPWDFANNPNSLLEVVSDAAKCANASGQCLQFSANNGSANDFVSETPPDVLVNGTGTHTCRMSLRVLSSATNDFGSQHFFQDREGIGGGVSENFTLGLTGIAAGGGTFQLYTSQENTTQAGGFTDPARCTSTTLARDTDYVVQVQHVMTSATQWELNFQVHDSTGGVVMTNTAFNCNDAQTLAQHYSGGDTWTGRAWAGLGWSLTQVGPFGAVGTDPAWTIGDMRCREGGYYTVSPADF